MMIVPEYDLRYTLEMGTVSGREVFFVPKFALWGGAKKIGDQIPGVHGLYRGIIYSADPSETLPQVIRDPAILVARFGHLLEVSDKDLVALKLRWEFPLSLPEQVTQDIDRAIIMDMFADF